eukprot:1408190-Prymnesium_polylepis.1
MITSTHAKLQARRPILRDVGARTVSEYICPTVPTVVTYGMHRNLDGPSTVPRIPLHDPVTNVP